MGPGNDMSLGMCAELSRVAVDQGLLEQAADWDQQAVQRLDAAGITHPAARLPPLAGRLLTQVLSNRVARADALAQAWQLRKALEAEPTVSGLRRAETWIALARVGLLQGDAGLVSQVCGAPRADGELMLADTTALGRRLKQLEAELQRLQGDLPTSARLLAEVASPLAPMPGPPHRVHLGGAPGLGRHPGGGWRSGGGRRAGPGRRAAPARARRRAPVGPSTPNCWGAWPASHGACSIGPPPPRWRRPIAVRRVACRRP